MKHCYLLLINSRVHMSLGYFHGKTICQSIDDTTSDLIEYGKMATGYYYGTDLSCISQPLVMLFAGLLEAI